MFDDLSLWLGDIHRFTSPQIAGVIVTFTAVICGATIGIERQRAQKPAGLRTLILICLGSAIFTQASLLLAEGFADRTRIAAQIVSGIGFLGAGAIIRERGMVIGVTTGAGIWATAAVGVVVGGGYIAAGLFFSLLIMFTLSAAQFIDRLVSGPCVYKTLRLEFDPDGGRTRLAIQALLDDHQHMDTVTFEDPQDGPGVALIRYCDSHRDHRTFMSDLLRMKHILRMQQD